MIKLNFKVLAPMYFEEDYDELCKRADGLGMDSLTEDEQYFVDNYHRLDDFISQLQSTDIEELKNVINNDDNNNEIYDKYINTEMEFHLKKTCDSLPPFLIRRILKQDLDIDKYAVLNENNEPVFKPNQMARIITGLEKGLDVDKYAMLDKDGKPVFNWAQMEEILLGLKNSLDVDKYTTLNKDGKPVFDWPQMREIRWGLEKHLDVDKYTTLDKDGKPVFGRNQMKKIRERLERLERIYIPEDDKFDDKFILDIDD